MMMRAHLLVRAAALADEVEQPDQGVPSLRLERRELDPVCLRKELRGGSPLHDAGEVKEPARGRAHNSARVEPGERCASLKPYAPARAVQDRQLAGIAV